MSLEKRSGNKILLKLLLDKMIDNETEIVNVKKEMGAVKDLLEDEIKFELILIKKQLSLITGEEKYGED